MISKRYGLALVLSSLAANVFADTVVFTYKVPTLREDGTALASGDIAACSIYNVTGTSPVRIVEQRPPAGTYTYVITSTVSSKYAASCVDKNGLSSKMSGTITYTPLVVTETTPPTTVPIPTSTSKPKATLLQVKLKFAQ